MTLAGLREKLVSHGWVYHPFKDFTKLVCIRTIVMWTIGYTKPKNVRSLTKLQRATEDHAEPPGQSLKR